MRSEENARRFGWVDWVILLLVGGVVFLGVYYWRISRIPAGQMHRITYTLCVSDLDEALVAEALERVIPPNSVVMNQNGTAELGQVSSVRTRSVLQAVVENQRVEFISVPHRIELLITVEASAAQQAGDGFRVGDIRIAAGKRGDFRIGGLFAANASIIRVEVMPL